jgi:hypothetical protein
MALEIIVPVLMSCAVIWWVGRGMSWTLRLTVIAITLAIVAIVLFVERGLT